MQVQFLPIESIFLGQRQRTEAPEQHIKDLANDIIENGLIHAISINNSNELVAGACRLSAIKLLTAPYLYGREWVPVGFIPAVVLSHTDERILFRVELMENLRRKNLSPLDEAKAVTKLHKMFLEEQGPSWSRQQTGAKVDEIAGQLPRHPDKQSSSVGEALLLDSFSNDPDVARAKTRQEAVKVAKKKLEQQLLGGLGGLQILQHMDLEVIHGDCRLLLPSLPSETFNGIICDPPYGIGADNFGDQTMAGGHTYSDTEAGALDVSAIILNEGFRLCKPDAHLYMFCDIRLWPSLMSQARSVGWLPFSTPLIWHKPGLGHAPQPGYFGRRYECILFAQKGNRKLSKSHSDVFEFPAVKDKIHAAQKPVDLVAEMLALSFFPGEHVLDPCCGAGTIFRAAHKSKIKATGIELGEEYYQICRQVIGELK